MKKTFKTIGLSIASVALIFGFTTAALNAWGCRRYEQTSKGL